jgi:hypothetical protein
VAKCERVYSPTYRLRQRFKPLLHLQFIDLPQEPLEQLTPFRPNALLQAVHYLLRRQDLGIAEQPNEPPLSVSVTRGRFVFIEIAADCYIGVTAKKQSHVSKSWYWRSG